MKTNVAATLSLLAVLCVGCAATEPETTAEAPQQEATIPDQSNIPPEKRLRVGPKAPPPKPEVAAVSFGRGIASGDGMKVTFMHNVTRFENGSAEGIFSQSSITESGSIDIEVDVTCAVLDGKEGKAWIAGTVKRNGSTSLLFAGPSGREAGFRLLDRGAEEQAAWITLAAFGSAADYCSKQPWSEKGLMKLEQGALAIFP